MKKLLNIFVFILFFQISYAQKPSNFEHMEHSLPKFSLSLNPIGFAQFGPIINAEFGLNDRLLLNTHVRLSPLGALSYMSRSDNDDELDRINGMAFGGGLIYFLNENKNKLYIGFLAQYEKLDNLYEEGNQWEWQEKENNIAFMINPGYRFTFHTFFINTGGYFGVASTSYQWNFTDPESPYSKSGNGGSGKDIVPFYLLDISFGVAF
ncbi:hypothetical protein [Flexithrix dorotheae]|uniref:hypothetical protein n=1 Tax=Flexithrix dorotheae TaxID=70993 RepID=UPI0012FC3788|nr:hypothetical protein [Flexithrix dorotheae]